MFTIVAMPLHELFAATGEPELGVEIQQALESMLTEELGREAGWDEGEAASSEARGSWIADDVGPYPIYALRAAAAWLELHGSLEGFEITEEPWSHDALIEAIETDNCKKFQQLLFSESWVAAFVPVEFDTVYILAYGEEDEGDDDNDDDDDDDDDLVLALGSLPALRTELTALGEVLGMEAFEPDREVADVELDADADPLAAVKLAWLVLSAQAHIAVERGLPLLLVEEMEPFDDEDDEDDDFDDDDDDNNDD